MARIIQHVCLYCQRCFKGHSSRYRSHIQKHRQWYHKYRFQIWKSKTKYSKFQKQPKYSKEIRSLNRQRNLQQARSSSQRGIKKKTVDIVNCTAYQTQIQHDKLSVPAPKNSNPNCLTELPSSLASSSSTDPASSTIKISPKKHDGLPTMVASSRHLPARNEKKNYKCSFCEKTFSGGSHLLLHERTHTGEKPHFCRFCPKSFAQKGYLKIHERIHTGERPFKCAFCKKAFCTKEDLRRHERIHTGEKPYKCKICGRGFSQRSYRNKHETIHSGERPFASKPANSNWDILENGPNMNGESCIPYLPSSLFDNLQNAGLMGTNGDLAVPPEMLERLKELSPAQQLVVIEGSFMSGRGRGRPKGSTNRQNYNCRFCGRDCRSSSQLKQHERTHTGEKPFSCKFCQKSFSQRGYARIHERIHTGEKPFPCEVCEKAFGAKEDLRRHQRTHTGEKPYKCELCGKAFAQNSALIGHRKTHLNEISNLDYTTHSFVGMQPQTTLNYPTQYIGPPINLINSAHMLHKMATEISGTEGNPNMKAEIPEFGEKQDNSGIPKHLPFPLPSLASQMPNILSTDAKGPEIKETQESGVKRGIDDIAAQLLASRADSYNTTINSKEHLEAGSENHPKEDQKNIQGGKLTSTDCNKLLHPERNVYPKKPSTEAERLDSMCQNPGVTIADHIRMQLSYTNEISAEAHSPTDTTHKTHGEQFVSKNNKINNLASQLLTAKTMVGGTPLLQAESKTVGFSKHCDLPQNDSIYHRAAQQMHPQLHGTDENRMNTVDIKQHFSDDLDFSYRVPMNLNSVEQIENRNNAVDGAPKLIGMHKSNKMTVHSSPSEIISKEQGQKFVSKKNNINDLASQLLSAKYEDVRCSSQDDPIKDSVCAVQALSDHSELPRNDSIYHRAAARLMKGGMQVKINRIDLGETITAANQLSVQHDKMENHLEFAQRFPEMDQPSVLKPAEAAYDPDFSSSLSGNLGESEQVHRAVSNIHSNINQESSTRLHNIAAQLICTRSNEAQLICTRSNEALVGSTLPGLNFVEEMHERKQKREMSNGPGSTTPIRPSITSICRPLQGILNRRTLQNL